MAGHSKRHNIRHKKAKTDAAKAKVYAKISKIITMAAQQGEDPALNPGLENALQKAKAEGLPKHVIQKAIDKGAGKIDGGDLAAVYYEGYGPGGSALYIRALTDNMNRSSSAIKAIFARMGYAMGEPGSVSRQFTEKGCITITGKRYRYTDKGQQHTRIDPLDPVVAAEESMEWEIEDVRIDETLEMPCMHVTTHRDMFAQVISQAKAAGFAIGDASLQHIAQTTITLSDADQSKLFDLLEQFDEDDDVDEVYHNAIV